MKLLLATHNRNKVRELRHLIAADPVLAGAVTVLSMEDIGEMEDIVEDGTTFAENALIKARAGAALGYVTVADDSGLEVDALGGAPGVYSARYAGEPCDDAANNALLLSNLRQVPEAERTARYRAVIACVFPDGRSFTEEGACEGRILFEAEGEGGFGYDPLFWQIDLGKTFANTTEEEKNRVSHRGIAMRKFCARFRDYLEDTTC